MHSLSIRTLVLKYLSHCGHFIASEVLWAALICSFGLSRLHTVPVGDAVKRSKYSKYSNSKYIDKVVSRNISQFTQRYKYKQKSTHFSFSSSTFSSSTFSSSTFSSSSSTSSFSSVIPSASTWIRTVYTELG